MSLPVCFSFQVCRCLCEQPWAYDWTLPVVTMEISNELINVVITRSLIILLMSLHLSHCVLIVCSFDWLNVIVLWFDWPVSVRLRAEEAGGEPLSTIPRLSARGRRMTHTFNPSPTYTSDTTHIKHHTFPSWPHTVAVFDWLFVSSSRLIGSFVPQRVPGEVPRFWHPEMDSFPKH